MWDIPGGTGLAIQTDVLPEDPPAALQKETALLSAEHLNMAGSVAVIDIGGVITPYSNILSMLFGGTDIASLEAQFAEAIADPAVAGIVLRIDSPGGLITGIEEFAGAVAAARGIKPIVAYAYGNAASAAYWIASAADKIVAGPTTVLGSIGVAMAVAKDRDSRWVKFVSSGAPYKNLDPLSEKGRESIQKRLDAMEAEFVGAVARFRNVSPAYVLSEFGQGDVLPARDAVRTGMADHLGGFKDALALISTLQQQRKGDTMTKPNQAPHASGDEDMIARSDLTADYIAANFPSIASALTAQGREEAAGEINKASFNEGFKAGAEAERKRILSIEEVSMPGHDDLVRAAKEDGKTTAGDLAMRIVSAEKQRGSKKLKSMEEEAGAQPAIQPSSDPVTPGADANAPVEDRAEAEWNGSPDIRTEFGSKEAYVAYRKAEEEGRVKRYVRA